MNKLSKENKVYILLIGIVTVPFFLYKTYNLSSYTMYKGKVERVEPVTGQVVQQKFRTVDFTREAPVVVYTRQGKRIEFTDGKLVLYNGFDKGDEVTVLENDDDRYKATLFSIWYYWISAQNSILLLFAYIFLLATYKTFINKKS